jgi:hypothetical protein
VERASGADSEGFRGAIVTLELGAQARELPLERRPATLVARGLLAKALDAAATVHHGERNLRAAKIEADPLFGGVFFFVLVALRFFTADYRSASPA